MRANTKVPYYLIHLLRSCELNQFLFVNDRTKVHITADAPRLSERKY